MLVEFSCEVDFILSVIKNQLFGLPIDMSSADFDTFDWNSFFTIANRQSVLPIMIQYISETVLYQIIDNALLLRWRAAAICQVVSNEHLMASQDEVIQILNSEQIPYAILKGTSVSFCYPRPELRLFGDIDFIVAPVDLERTAKALCENGYSRREVELHVHEVLDKGSVRVEPHYTIADIPDNIAGKNIKSFLDNALQFTEMAEIKPYSFSVLSPPHQAVALLVHMEKHITKSGIDLRRLCDWAVFIETRACNSVWESQIHPILFECGLSQFAHVITKICVKYFGLDQKHCLWAFSKSDKKDDILCKNLMGLILKSCDADNRQRGLAIQFSVEKKKSDKVRSTVHTIVSNISAIAVRDFRIIKKAPILFPFIWAYCAVKNLIRFKSDAHSKTSIYGSLKEAKQLKALFDDLKIFKTQNS